MKNEESDIYLERASFENRLIARIMDYIVVIIACSILSIIPAMLAGVFKNTSSASTVNSFIPVAVLIAYYVIYPCKNNGQTAGKKQNSIRIMTIDGSKLTWRRLFIRELFATYIIFILIEGIRLTGIGVYSLAYLWLLTHLLALTEKKRALHDIIAGTCVVKTG